MKQSQDTTPKRKKHILFGIIMLILLAVYFLFLHPYDGFKNNSEYTYDEGNHSIMIVGDIDLNEEWAKAEAEWRTYSLSFNNGVATEKMNNAEKKYYYIVSEDIIFLYDPTLKTILKTVELTNSGKTISYSYNYEVNGDRVYITVNFTRGEKLGIFN